MPILPYELLETILAHGKDDMDTLKSWARASKAWTTPAQRYLFKRLALGTPEDVRSLTNLAPHLDDLVEAVTISLRLDALDCATIVQRFGRAREFQFIYVPPDFRILYALQHLQTLKIDFGYNHALAEFDPYLPPVKPIEGFACQQTHLRKLSFVNAPPSMDKWSESVNTWLRETQTQHVGSLSRLDVDPVNAYCTSTLVSFLEEYTSITDVSVAIDDMFFQPGRDQQYSAIIILLKPAHTEHILSGVNIQCLAIESTIYSDITPPVFAMLRASTLPSLTRLTLHFKLYKPSSRLESHFHPFGDFGEMEAHYSHPDQYALPPSLVSSLRLLAVRFNHFDFIHDSPEFMALFGDAVERHIMRLDTGGAVLLGE
jgi:hypothetical protein